MMTPSRGRILLALYIDFLVFTAVYRPVVWAIDSAGGETSTLMAVAIFAVLRGGAWALRLVLPGEWALGIRSGPPRAVDPYLRHRERWWTIVAGTLLVLEGSKNLVRWTQALPVQPLLGSGAPEWAGIATISCIGLANLLAGVLILRTRVAGPVVGIGVLGRTDRDTRSWRGVP
jgi:hypothetical protein